MPLRIRVFCEAAIVRRATRPGLCYRESPLWRLPTLSRGRPICPLTSQSSGPVLLMNLISLWSFDASGLHPVCSFGVRYLSIYFVRLFIILCSVGRHRRYGAKLTSQFNVPGAGLVHGHWNLWHGVNFSFSFVIISGWYVSWGFSICIGHNRPRPTPGADLQSKRSMSSITGRASYRPWHYILCMWTAQSLLISCFMPPRNFL